MITYEIQLRYVIQDKIQDKRQNPAREKNFCQKNNFVRKKIVRKKLSRTLPWISSVQSELSQTN